MGFKTVYEDCDILIVGGGMGGCGAAFEARYWGRDLTATAVSSPGMASTRRAACCLQSSVHCQKVVKPASRNAGVTVGSRMDSAEIRGLCFLYSPRHAGYDAARVA